jgi:hypothetical protein
VRLPVHFEKFVVVAILLLGPCGCGDPGRVPQVGAQTPLSLPDISVRQAGTAAVAIDPGSVSFTTDASGALVIKLRATSRAGQNQTILVHASVFDPAGVRVGDAASGRVDVQPGQTVAVQPNGPPPHGTIAATTLEVTTQASPTASS